MPELAANERVIGAAKCLKPPVTQYAIRGGRGLMLDVFPSGSKAYIVRYRIRADGKRLDRRYVIGDATRLRLGQAIDAADEVLRAVAAGQDPFVERKAQRNGPSPTESFDGLYKLWLETHAKPNHATWADEDRRYRLRLQEPLGHKAAKSITRDDVAAIRDKIFQAGSPIESNRVVALFNRIMNFGVDERQVEINPCAKMRKLGVERARTRVLTMDGLSPLWQGLDRAPISRIMALAIKLTILTGQRRTEVIGALKSEFNLGERNWTIPGRRIEGDATSGGSKNQIPQLVPLAPLALGIVQTAMAEAGGSLYLFPSHKTGVAMRGDAMTMALRRTYEALQLAPISPHDLRRTINTEMAKLGIPKDHRKLILNHSDGRGDTISTHYDVHDYIPEKLAAFMKWEERVKAVLGL